jgi:glycosyltransferase involved in cell wall biosynthesis
METAPTPVPTTDSSISVVLITKNEEHNIRDCLKSVDWADEVVVVDAESQDRTRELAGEYTQRVFVRPKLWNQSGCF